MNVKKLGIIGNKFGSIVKSEVDDEYNVLWVANSGTNLGLLPLPDLVYIATPLETHYELSYKFLKQGVAVLLEKTACLSAAATKSLINLAKVENTFIYFSDLPRFNEN